MSDEKKIDFRTSKNKNEATRHLRGMDNSFNEKTSRAPRSAAIIPTYNEGERVVPIAEAARQHVDEVFIVDDGSDETSYRILDRLRGYACILRHRINLGKGSALRTGIQAAIARGAQIIIVLDADGQHKPSDIPRFINAIVTKNVDIVFGSRRINSSMPTVMRFGNYFLSLTTRLFFRINISDTQSGFRAFRSEIYPKIEWKSPRYTVETEMIVNAGKHHVRYGELMIDTIYHDNYKGTTVFDGVRIFWNMLLWRIL